MFPFTRRNKKENEFPQNSMRNLIKFHLFFLLLLLFFIKKETKYSIVTELSFIDCYFKY
jgi:hypothetical protein